jgi:hypothetical protein
MNTQVIRHALLSNTVTAKICRGVFAADQVPSSVDPYPSAYVVNTDKAGQPGRHWLAIYQEKDDCVEYFDSFGRDPDHYGLSSVAKGQRVVCQGQALQSPFSTVCGQYCLFFLLRRACGESFAHIVHLFTSSKESNDTMVCQYINYHFDLHTVVYSDKFLKQIAKQIN